MRVTIGLEIHSELKTKTKLFCNSLNDPDEKRPNVNICPICMAHPGVLPVINKEAVRSILRVGLAVKGKRADFSEFDRKNYFYPDIPKGYQISQYKYPLISGGELAGVAITRVHLEEDTARLGHVISGKPGGEQELYSLVDFNRAGVPLMELVTEPVIHDSATAVKFAKELQMLLRYLEVSDADMEKGLMRVEANISVSPDDTFGTKVEVKNLNSFRAVERAIEYEIVRQTKLIEAGERVVQETRGWNENRQETFSQRIKEGSKDYRYFPEPDLVKFTLSEVPEFGEEVLRSVMPELPEEKRARYQKEYGLKAEDTEVFIADEHLREIFEEAISNSNKESYQLTANYITSDLIGLMRKENSATHVTGSGLKELVKLVLEGKISSRGAKDILSAMHKEGGSANEIAQKLDLFQSENGDELKALVLQVIEKNPGPANDYKAGKVAALQFLVGEGMKASKGKANPAVLRKLLEETLK